MNVLMAIDGSYCSMVAAERIREYFPTDRLDVLSIVPVLAATAVLASLTGNPESLDGSPEVVAAQTALDAVSVLLARDPDNVYHLGHGDPGPAIVTYAREHASDVIVLGCHGRGPLGRLLMGSVATYVMHHAECAVLIIKERALAGQTHHPEPTILI